MNHLFILRLALLAIILPAMSGCIVVHKETRHETTRSCDSEVIYVDDDATIVEIEATRTLDFSSERADHLYRIARRPGIGPDAQVCLVDTTFNVLGFESEKMRVIQTLIKNPTFTAAGKTRILNRLGDLGFSSNRQRILRDLDRRGPVIDYTDEPVCEDEVIIEIPHNEVHLPAAPVSE